MEIIIGPLFNILSKMSFRSTILFGLSAIVSASSLEIKDLNMITSYMQKMLPRCCSSKNVLGFSTL